MLTIIYHGSDHVIQKPIYGHGSRNNDFGRGFYCTADKELAKEWACRNGQNGYVNAYLLDHDSLKILNLNEEPYHILNWLALLTNNRTYWQRGSISQSAKSYIKDHYSVDLSSYDVVIGYRADDSYFAIAQDFAAGTISLQKLSEAMRRGHLGEQIVLKSQAAFEHITFQYDEMAEADEYYVRKVRREREARMAYRKSREEAPGLDEIYILDVMREGMKNDDARLR